MESHQSVRYMLQCSSAPRHALNVRELGKGELEDGIGSLAPDKLGAANASLLPDQTSPQSSHQI